MKWDRDWKWTRTIGNEDGGPPVFFIKSFLNLFGYHIDLHKFVKEDKPGCFHTHPAYAIRIILEGGYLEQEYVSGDADGLQTTRFHLWLPGSIGIVRPSFAHRIEELVNGKYSYSLWLRGRVAEKIILKGWGWNPDQINQESSYKSKN